MTQQLNLSHLWCHRLLGFLVSNRKNNREYRRLLHSPLLIHSTNRNSHLIEKQL